MTRNTKILGVAVFLAVILIVIPVFITISERWDLYYTLTSVALLSIASGGVWLTFYIGRINIGQGAYALMAKGPRRTKGPAARPGSVARRLPYPSRRKPI